MLFLLILNDIFVTCKLLLLLCNGQNYIIFLLSMSQVFGIDFGTNNILISTVNKGSTNGKYPITIIENAFSKRKTVYV